MFGCLYIMEFTNPFISVHFILKEVNPAFVSILKPLLYSCNYVILYGLKLMGYWQLSFTLLLGFWLYHLHILSMHINTMMVLLFLLFKQYVLFAI